MYLDYWNLQKAPFDNVPDPSMYTECHESMEKVISETIFGIKEADEDFAVIIGTVGSGKTLAIKVIMDALEPDKYLPVLITSPAIPFAQLLNEIISQVTSEPCAENRKLHLLQTFHRLLFKTMEKGQKIVIFIDEADSMSPANLDNLRLLTRLQDDQRNLFALVLAGQIELARRLEHPKRSNLFQRIGIYGRIDKLPSPEAVKKYIEARLLLASTQKMIFPTETIQAIWENSDQGIPRLINKICKLCLIEAAAGGLTQVPAELVLQVAQRFQKLGRPAIQSRKPRCVPDDFEISDIVEMTEEVAAMISWQPDTVNNTTSGDDKAASSDHKEPSNGETTGQAHSSTDTKETSAGFTPPVAALPAREPDVQNLLPVAAVNLETTAGQELPPLIPEHQDEKGSEMTTTHDGEAAATQKDKEVIPEADEKSAAATGLKDDEVTIGSHTVRLDIPKEILERVKSFNRASALKSAGFWAAKILKNNPQLTQAPQADPVHIWSEIKDGILKRLSL